jgi:hypothetical protein
MERIGRCSICGETRQVRYVRKLNRMWDREPIGTVLMHEIWLCTECTNARGSKPTDIAGTTAKA